MAIACIQIPRFAVEVERQRRKDVSLAAYPDRRRDCV